MLKAADHTYQEIVLGPIFTEENPFVYYNDFQIVKLHQNNATINILKSAFLEK